MKPRSSRRSALAPRREARWAKSGKNSLGRVGWGELDGIQYYVRQLRDMKGGVAIEPGKFHASSLSAYARSCGWALALAHAKSGDAVMLAGYLGRNDVVDTAIARFSRAYADQTEQDHALLVKAARSGRIKVATNADAGLTSRH